MSPKKITKIIHAYVPNVYIVNINIYKKSNIATLTVHLLFDITLPFMYTIFKSIHVQYVIFKANKHNSIEQCTLTQKT